MRTSDRRTVLRSLGLVAAAVLAGPGTIRRAVSANAVPGSDDRISRPADVGATRRLEILPLVDWHTAGPELKGEPGVSYLVRTDRSTILFDVGANLAGEEPSPLVANMRRLGIELASIDTIVISHAHMDHVGGLSRARASTFSMDRQQVDLAGKRVFVPVPMTYPGLAPVVSREPTVISPGVVTTGPINAEIFMGPVSEQALAVRVEGKGIVLVVGCGHQTLPGLLARWERLFDEPLYGIVGGLHYPVPRGRWTTAGIDTQRWATYGMASGPTLAEVQREIDLLAAKQPQWVSLSPHDSSDEVIEAFRKTFGARYHDLRVGEAQVVAAGQP